jgi:ribosomal protein L29
MTTKKQKEQVAQLRERPEGELDALLRDKLDEYRKLRFKHALGQLPNNHVLGAARRHIAKLKTVLVQRQRGQEERT